MLPIHKQENNKIQFPELSSENHHSKSHNTGKGKRICKQSQKFKQQSEASQEVYGGLNKKKENAKEIKRIREQARRAVHKEYVANLQLQIQNKDIEIKKLQFRIVELEEQLQAKTCHKCGGDLTETENMSPVLLQKINSISVEENHYESNIDKESPLDSFEQFRRIDDEKSVRICYGIKNLLFFFVAMCCLTTGSIADNPEILFQPILPFKTKSKMCYLKFYEKLDNYSNYRNRTQLPQMEFDEFQRNRMSLNPQLVKDVKRVSDMFSVPQLFSKLLPQKIPDLLTSVKDSYQMILDFGTNQMLSRFLGGQNYYM